MKLFSILLNKQEQFINFVHWSVEILFLISLSYEYKNLYQNIN